MFRSAVVGFALAASACALGEPDEPVATGAPVEAAAPIARVGGITQTPWGTNASGTLYTDQAWDFALGYHFTPKVDGFVTDLGGFFRGTKRVKLFDTASGALLAETDVTSANAWSYVPISWVRVTAGTTYTVAGYFAGSGGSVRFLSSAQAFPRDLGDVRIEGTTWASTAYDPALRPTNVYGYAMYGQVDVGFRSATQAQPALRTITRNRYGANNAYSLFGIALATSGNRLVALAPWERPPTGGIGTVNLLDGETGGYVGAMTQPAGGAEGLGYTVAANAHFIAAGDSSEPCGTLTRCGRVWVWSADTGALAYTLTAAAPTSYGLFGKAVAISGSTLAVASGNVGAVQLYDLPTGALVRTIANPSPASSGAFLDNFGNALAFDGNRLLVAAQYDERATGSDTGTVYLFDATTGALLREIPNPTPASYEYFGSSVALAGNRIAVGIPNRTVNGVAQAGAVAVFDATTGAPVGSFAEPTPGTYAQFARYVGSANGVFLAGGGAAAAAYVLSTDGALLSTIPDPEPALKGHFGRAFAGVNGLFAIGRPFGEFEFGNWGSDDSAVYLFE